MRISALELLIFANVKVAGLAAVLMLLLLLLLLLMAAAASYCRDWLMLSTEDPELGINTLGGIGMLRQAVLTTFLLII